MRIADNWTIEDAVSGLRITVHKGIKLNSLIVEHISKPIIDNRYFWFDKQGKFDGTGSDVRERPGHSDSAPNPTA